MKAGRNDPCPCGSGKKYKKCCMEKDQEAARVLPNAHARLSPTGDTPKFNADEPLDPHVEAINARWEAFEALDDYEEQIALFIQTLDEDGLMDEEMAFDMLSTIDEHSLEHGDHDRLDALLEKLRERLPEVYAHDAPYYLEWRIAHFLASGRTSAIPALSSTLAETAGRDIDSFNRVIEQLAYHGQLATLVDTLRIAWPQVRESREIVPWGITEFAERAGTYAVFDALEQGAAADCTEAALTNRIKAYQDVDPDELARYIEHVTGQTKESWTLGDFSFGDPGHAEATGHGEENLFYLGVEFLGYLRREEGVSYPKGELGRQQIQQYLLDRQAGKLEWRESPLEKALQPGKTKRKPPSSPPDHGLCPDHETLDRHLGQLLNFINPQRYKAAALMELIPAWLRFLESRQLIDAAQREKTLRGLRELAGELLKVWEAYRADPALREGLENSALASAQ